MSNALGTLFGDIANAIREKNGETGTMKPAEFPEKILGIEGSSPDVCYVTFMSYDGTVEYGKKAVAVGDDCADPITRGIFATPTRESTAQYNYTFAGWSTEANGGLDSTALKAVSADRTVYANFAAVLRYYTITYYDGDTVLKTENLAYGSMPSYSAEKDDFNFEGWEPELTTVKGDASYYAQWSEQLTFAGASWATIAEISEAGQAADYFAVGDTKTISFDGQSITVAIAGFDHDDLADGSGKAGMSIVLMGVPTATVLWHNSTTTQYYPNCTLNSTLSSWKSKLPSELQAVVKQVAKVCDAGISGGSTTLTANCYLWALSFAELGWEHTSCSQYALLGKRYELFPALATDKLYPVGLPTISETEYWARQLQRVSVFKPTYVTSGGANGSITNTALPTTRKAVRFGFCI